MRTYSESVPLEKLDREGLQHCYRAAGLELRLQSLAEQGPPLFCATIPGGAAAIDVWEHVRALVPQTGYWPLMMGAQLHDLPETTEAAVQEILKRARSLTAEDFFKANARFLPRPEDEYDEWSDMAAEMGLQAPTYGPIQDFSTPYHVLSGQAHKQLQLLLIPSQKAWEVSAYLPFGGWNACPEPALQVVLQKYWHEKYAAEPVCLSGDVLEMRVLCPPTTEAAALELAQEQYMFCGDIVDQGVMTLDNLKKTLLNGKIWYFWWD